MGAAYLAVYQGRHFPLVLSAIRSANGREKSQLVASTDVTPERSRPVVLPIRVFSRSAKIAELSCVW